MNSFDLDELDRHIIAALQEDARRTNREIADLVASTEPTVRRRIERMVSGGALKIVGVVSPFALGYPVVALLGLRIDRRYQKEIEAALTALPEVRFMGFMLGSFDVMLEAWFPDNTALLEFLNETLARISGIRDIESWQALKLSKYAYDWGVQPSVAPPE